MSSKPVMESVEIICPSGGGSFITRTPECPNSAYIDVKLTDGRVIIYRIDKHGGIGVFDAK